MKPEDASSHRSTLTDADRDQCVRYLLGELNPEEMAEFEQQLATSELLGEELLQQAELISQLACLPCETAVLAEASHPASRWPMLTAVVAIAACVAWALLTLRPEGQNQFDLASVADTEGIEALLIAKAWADNPLNDDTGEDSLLPLHDAVDLVADDVSQEDASSIDSALSWMSIALTVELELPPEGVSDDG